ncbi:MAG: glycosyltransferase family 4 protein [Kiritimatiellaeota bacterium]|nr:glycosyltransferase family 4 protein [Kiritimatiellota bacterium]
MRTASQCRVGCVHVLGHPSRPLDVGAAPADAQVFNCRNFCLLLSRAGLRFVYYGLPGSRLPESGGELVEIGEATGPWEYGNAWHREYTRRLDAALEERVSTAQDGRGIVVSLYGCAQADIATPERFGLPVIEAMVGYDHCWAPYRVFPSYAHQHVIYGKFGDELRESIWFDTVIPHFLDPVEYDIIEDKGDYALFLGRDAPDKGGAIAADICRRAGVPLRMIHDGLSGRDKTEMLARAVAVFMPTVYVEPFGYVAVEAQMCGVPVLTTDWGAFVETVEHGRTGFRCRTAAEFLAGLAAASDLDPDYIRARAVRRYSIQAVTPAYLAYFDFVCKVHRNGYYAPEALRWPSHAGADGA